METKIFQEQLWQHIDAGEKVEAVHLLAGLAKELGFKTVIFEVLEPMLVEIGKLWMQEKVSLAHGYVTGKIAEEFYMLASHDPEFIQSNLTKKGTVVIGNIEDDFHPLGRRLVRIYSESVGWSMVDLENDVPAEFFIEKALEHNANIIAVSAMMFTTARNIAKVRDEIEKNGLSGKVKLAVGGAVFKLRPELVKQVGGDGTADNAIDAPALFESLLVSRK